MVKEVKIADLCDEFYEELQICKLSFQSYGKKKTFSGPIATVKVKNDNVLVREAISSISKGAVLVVDGEGSKDCALLGDRLATIALKRELAGIIIYGCVRDSAELAKLNLGILAIGTMPLKSKKEGKGERDVAIQFGGVEWTPRNYVYADEDGVVISSRSLA
jgi:regulator of ribonuclease activity A